MSFGIALAFASTMATVSDISIDAIAAGVEQHRSEYRNLEFVIAVKVQVGDDSSKLLEAVDTFRILAPTSRESSRPWRCWVRQVEYEEFGGELLIQRFVAFNGKELAVFSRAYGERRRHKGTVYAFEDWEHYEGNPFDRLLFSDIYGVPAYTRPGKDHPNPHRNSYKITGIKEGVCGEDVYALEGRSKQLDVEYRVEVSTVDFILTRLVAFLPKKPDGPYVEWVVTSIDRYDTMAYPSSGTLRQRDSMTDPGLSYEFRVKSVKRLSEDAREGWTPAWPPGTSVTDLVRSAYTNVPFDTREADRVRIARLGDSVERNSGRSLFPIYVLVLNVLLIVLIVAFFLWRRRAKRM